MTSCSFQSSEKDSLFREEKFKLTDFPEKKLLVSKTYIFVEILDPHQVMLKRDKLIVSSLTSDIGLFVIDNQDMSLKKSLGKIGFGPDEIADVWQMDRGINPDTFWVYSFSGKEFSQFPLSDNSSKPLDKIRLKEERFQSLTMNWLPQSEIIAYQNVGASRFAVFDTTLTRVQSIGFWLTGEDSALSMEASFVLSRLNQGAVGVSPKGKKIVLAQVKTDSFEIIDLNSNKIIKVIGPLNQEFEYSLEADGSSIFPYIKPDLKNGYNHLEVGEDKIFLLFIGRSDEEIVKTGLFSTDIFVFDFEGKALIHYSLDRSVKSISVDERSNKIYAVTFEKEPGIAVFDY